MQTETVPPPQQMMGLITGYWRTQAVAEAARLAIADRLASGSKSTATLAQEAQVDEAALFRLLRALSSIGVFRQTGERTFGLTPLAETLRSNVPGSMRDMAIAQAAPGHWLAWGKLDDAVRTGQRSAPGALGCELFEWYGKNPVEAAAFSGAMGNLSALAAKEVAQVLKVPAGAKVADLGGAFGHLLSAVLNANPTARGVLVDLPHVIDGAPRTLATLGAADRIELVAGDFFQTAPQADVYLLKHVLHDWDDAQCAKLLANVARAAKPGAKVAVIEMVVPEDGSPSMAPQMDLNMLVLVPGKERTASEYSALFQAAGFSKATVTPTHSPYSVVEATKL